MRKMRLLSQHKVCIDKVVLHKVLHFQLNFFQISLMFTKYLKTLNFFKHSRTRVKKNNLLNFVRTVYESIIFHLPFVCISCYQAELHDLATDTLHSYFGVKLSEYTDFLIRSICSSLNFRWRRLRIENVGIRVFKYTSTEWTLCL